MNHTILFLLSTLAACAVASHLVAGDFAMGELIHSTEIQYNAIPFKKRVKNYFYTQPDNRKIRGFQALDNLQSKASINVTAGGVGHSFVNFRLKSERGRGLDYSLGIYVEPINYSGNYYQTANQKPQ